MIPTLEPEIQDGMRGFEKTQELFAGSPTTSFFTNPLRCTWYGTEVSPYHGAFCVVKEGAGLDDLVGEFIRVTYRGTRKIYLYCVAETPKIPTQLGITRRAWNEIERLSLDEIFVYSQVIQ